MGDCAIWVTGEKQALLTLFPRGLKNQCVGLATWLVLVLEICSSFHYQERTETWMGSSFQVWVAAEGSMVRWPLWGMDGFVVCAEPALQVRFQHRGAGQLLSGPCTLQVSRQTGPAFWPRDSLPCPRGHSGCGWRAGELARLGEPLVSGRQDLGGKYPRFWMVHWRLSHSAEVWLPAEVTSSPAHNSPASSLVPGSPPKYTSRVYLGSDFEVNSGWLSVWNPEGKASVHVPEMGLLHRMPAVEGTWKLILADP